MRNKGIDEIIRQSIRASEVIREEEIPRMEGRKAQRARRFFEMPPYRYTSLCPDKEWRRK